MELTVDQALQQGVAAHKEGKLQDAERLYRAIIQSQPLHPDANHNLGVLAVSVNKADAALPLFKTALEANPKIDQFWLSYIDALIKEKQFETAKQALADGEKAGLVVEKVDLLQAQLSQITPTKDANLPEQKTRLTFAEKRKEASAKKKKKKQNANSLKPSQQQLSILLQHYQNRQYDEAEKLALSMTQKFPEHQFSWKVLGAVFEETGRMSAALGVNQKVVALTPEDADAHSNLGNTLRELHRLEEAVTSCRKAIALKPGLAEAHYNLGNTLRELDRLEKAETSYRQAIALKPDFAEAHSNLGIMLHELGRLKNAEASFRKAIAVRPEYAEAHSNLGITLHELGRLKNAEASFRKAIAVRPEYAEAHYNLGNTLRELDRLEKAETSYRQAIALKPDFAEAHSNLGIALHELGRLEEAETSYRQAMAVKPDHADAHSNLGITLHELGRLEESIKAYNKSLSIKPGSSDTWNNIVFPLRAIKAQISSDDKLRSLYPEDTNSKYAQIEKAILNYELNLGGENAGNSLNEALSFLASAENIAIKNPAGNKDPAGLGLELPDKVIAMMHFGRSGTGLLHSLIDGHSEVSTLPSIYLSQYFLHSNWEKIISGGWDEMANRFVAIYEVLFNAASTVPIETVSRRLLFDIGQKEGMANVGDHQNEVLSADKTLFRAELNRLMGFYDELDPFVFFKLVHAAYDKAINDLNQKNLLFYHIHNPDTYAQLNFLRSAPEGRGLIMVREPVQSCESWCRGPFLDNDHIRIATYFLKMLFEIDSIVYHKCNSIGVRLEDIKENPRQTITALCKWMGIKEAESLYEMTAQGKKWWGDPSSQDFKKDGMDPFGKISINRKVGSIFSEKDQFILRTLYYPFSVRFGYVEANFQQFKVDLQAIGPMLDQMFDFEKALVKRTQVDPKQFMKSGSYLYLRSGLVERWDTLNEFHTYPNMIEPLRIVSK
ncbi:tetratricopeptide repeat protein [Gammaproteobacteria bacterium]|nr:tetratricopeptide repeat protein [Gammaproteobacteria bacterium]